jgi:hypothetical protein
MCSSYVPSTHVFVSHMRVEVIHNALYRRLPKPTDLGTCSRNHTNSRMGIILLTPRSSHAHLLGLLGDLALDSSLQCLALVML